MYGGVIGDVSGSYLEVLEIIAKKNKTKRIYEDRLKIMNKNISLFNENSSITDDSILTIATSDAIINHKNYEDTLRLYGRTEIEKGLDRYGRYPFGSGFIKWINNESIGVSCGNGAAMRIGPIGYLFNNERDIKEEVIRATIPSHNHPDSIKYAYAVAISIYLLRRGTTKKELKEYLIRNLDIDLDFNLEYLRNNYTFTSKIVDTVPQALFCFLKSNNFEDAIRTTLSIGGDSDTLACIVGSISESYYGIPEKFIDEVKIFIPDNYQKVINEFYTKCELKLERTK